MKYRLHIIMLAILLASSVMAQSNSSPAQDAKPTTVEVKIDNFSFTPPTITIAAGATVHWTNRDDIPHTVVADDQSFKSKVLDTDQDYSRTFTMPGTYSYFCSIHPRMTGKVVVQ